MPRRLESGITMIAFSPMKPTGEPMTQIALNGTSFVALDSRYVPVGGETCQPSQFTEYRFARAELERMHWTYLNRGFNRRVIQQWKMNGLYAEAEKLLGYRLSLVSSDCDPSTAAGAAWKVELKFKNLGWAAPINPREVNLVLRAPDGSPDYQVAVPVDPRSGCRDKIWSSD